MDVLRKLIATSYTYTRTFYPVKNFFSFFFHVVNPYYIYVSLCFLKLFFSKVLQNPKTRFKFAIVNE